MTWSGCLTCTLLPSCNPLTKHIMPICHAPPKKSLFNCFPIFFSQRINSYLNSWSGDGSKLLSQCILVSLFILNGRLDPELHILWLKSQSFCKENLQKLPDIYFTNYFSDPQPWQMECITCLKFSEMVKDFGSWFLCVQVVSFCHVLKFPDCY